MFAGKVRKPRVQTMRQHTHRRWHLDEVYVKINGVQHDPWRAVDLEGEVLKAFATKTRDKAAALKFMKKLMKRHGCAKAITTDGLRSYKAAMKEVGIAIVRRWAAGPTTGRRTHTSRSDDENGRCSLQADEDAEQFASVHSGLHNHFNQERHLTSRDPFGERRSAALAEWRALAA